jgi:hypothetical protein
MVPCWGWSAGSGSRRAKMTHKNIKSEEISCFVKTLDPDSHWIQRESTTLPHADPFVYIYYFYNLDSTGNSYNFLMFVSYQYSKLFYSFYIYSHCFRRAACLKISPVWKALRWSVTLPVPYQLVHLRIIFVGIVEKASSFCRYRYFSNDFLLIRDVPVRLCIHQNVAT